MSKKPLKKDEIKRRTVKRKRKEGVKLVHPERFLIICEGTKTEPNYFNSIKNKIEEKYDNKINNRIKLEIRGTGRNTISLLNYAKDILEKNRKQGKEYDHIWLVYDSDDFPIDNFDNTAGIIDSMNESQIKPEKWHAAWSNQCIEIWFLLHFNYYNSDIHRSEYYDKLSDIFARAGVDKYRKNSEDIFDLLIEYGDLDKAISNAKKLCKDYEDKTPSKMAPATMVYKLIELLKPHFE